MHRKLKHRKNNSGLTLIEVVIASLLLAIAIVPILKCLSVANANTRKIEIKTQSLLLAQAKLDEIKTRSIYDFTNNGNSFTANNISLGNSYLCNITDDGGDPLKTVTVSVGFDSNGNNSLSSSEIEITLSTRLARRWID